MRIILFGGTGFIGRKLVNNLVEANHDLILFVRNPIKPDSLESKLINVRIFDYKTFDDLLSSIDYADAVINLAGEPIGTKRWTKKQKELIIRSRIDITRNIVSDLKKSNIKLKVFINASAVGYYGNVESGDVIEDHIKGIGFLSDICDQWEKEALSAEGMGIRTILLRFGIILGKEGGALKRMAATYKFFLGGKLGSGLQWLPWIHIDDVVDSIIFTLNTVSLSGAVNIVSPLPVRMNEFCSSLGKALRRPSLFPVPSIILKILLGEMSDMILTGQKAVPKKLLEAGYQFQYPLLTSALEAILQKNCKKI